MLLKLLLLKLKLRLFGPVRGQGQYLSESVLSGRLVRYFPEELLPTTPADRCGVVKRRGSELPPTSLKTS